MRKQIFYLCESRFIEDVEGKVDPDARVWNIDYAEDLHLHSAHTEDSVGLRTCIAHLPEKGDCVHERLPSCDGGIEVVLLAVLDAKTCEGHHPAELRSYPSGLIDGPVGIVLLVSSLPESDPQRYPSVHLDGVPCDLAVTLSEMDVSDGEVAS